MPKPWTKERLKALTTHELQTLYGHARETSSSEADDIIEMIFQNNLLDSIGGGLPRHHPTIQAIERICRAPEGVAAAVAAARRGEAPIAGIDPGSSSRGSGIRLPRYNKLAGTFVADEIEAAGWVRQGRKSLPENCVAKTAAFFVQPKEAI